MCCPISIAIYGDNYSCYGTLIQFDIFLSNYMEKWNDLAICSAFQSHSELNNEVFCGDAMHLTYISTRSVFASYGSGTIVS